MKERNHNAYRRGTALFLAGIMLIGTLSGCAKNMDSPETTAQTVFSEETEVTGSERVSDELPPDLDYNGREINIISRCREGWTSGEIAVEQTNGEPVNDAVYERNQMVENRLHVRLNSLEDHTDDMHGILNQFEHAVITGTEDYDMVAAACFAALLKMTRGIYADLSAADYIHPEKPWWIQGYNEATAYNGSLYTLTGTALLSSYRFSFATVFNKAMFAEAGVPDLYDAVRNLEWTLDFQAELLSRFHRDNGNGVADEEGDVYGLVVSDLISIDPYWSACDIPIIGRDEHDQYAFVFDLDRTHSAVDKILRVFYPADGSTYIYPQKPMDREQEDIRRMFAERGAAMATIRLMETESEDMRRMADDFGIVPMPKYDRDQPVYRTLMHDQFTVFAVPSYRTGEELDMMGAILEAMGSESHYRVRPAYYEITLRTKVAKDPDTAAMLDLIMAQIYIDAGLLYTDVLGSFTGSLRAVIRSGQNTTVSTFKSVMKRGERSLARLCRDLDRMQTKARG